MSNFKNAHCDIFRLRNEGVPVKEIARRSGLSECTIYNRLNLNVARPRRHPKGAERKCLCCGKPFLSEGAHNRLCEGCRRQKLSPFDFSPV